ISAASNTPRASILPLVATYFVEAFISWVPFISSLPMSKILVVAMALVWLPLDRHSAFFVDSLCAVALVDDLRAVGREDRRRVRDALAVVGEVLFARAV